MMNLEVNNPKSKRQTIENIFQVLRMTKETEVG